MADPGKGKQTKESPKAAATERKSESPSATANPSVSDDADDDELLNLARGDAVGDTLYSQRFILRTLMALSSEERNKSEGNQLENDLCSLWDMTVELDVAEFLLNRDFMAVFLHVVDSTEDLRLIEILVGMLGNICCHECGFQALTNDASVVEMLLKLMTCMDSAILTQLLRLLETAMTKLKSTKTKEATLWYQYFSSIDELAHKFAFILKMCKVGEVLTGCMKALNAILAKCALVDEEQRKGQQEVDAKEPKLASFVEIFLNEELIEGTSMAFSYLMEPNPGDEEEDSDNESDNKNGYLLRKAIDDGTFEVYINIHTILSQYEESTTTAYAQHINEVLLCLATIYKQYTDSSKLLPLSEQTEFFLESVIHISACLGHPFKKELFVYTFKIYQLLQLHLNTLTNKTLHANEFESEENKSSSRLSYVNNREMLLDFMASVLANSDSGQVHLVFEILPRSDIERFIHALNENEKHSNAATIVREAIAETKPKTKRVTKF